MTIDYQTSSGHGLSQGKELITVMTKMKQSVAEKVTNTYTTALFSKMGIT